MSETLSHQKAASLSKMTPALQNNTMKLLDKDPYYITTKEDEEDENNENHSDAKHADNRTLDKFPPRWKNPSRMFVMEMKPAGNSVKLKCVPDGKCTLKQTLNPIISCNVVKRTKDSLLLQTQANNPFFLTLARQLK